MSSLYRLVILSLSIHLQSAKRHLSMMYLWHGDIWNESCVANLWLNLKKFLPEFSTSMSLKQVLSTLCISMSDLLVLGLKLLFYIDCIAHVFCYFLVTKLFLKKFRHLGFFFAIAFILPETNSNSKIFLARKFDHTILTYAYPDNYEYCHNYHWICFFDNQHYGIEPSDDCFCSPVAK